MSDYVQLVGTDTPGAATGSCYFASGELRILFNCPEGTQRFAGDARIRITKCNVFMFTRVCVHSTMGLPGFLFTINDTQIDRAVFGGPPQPLSHLTANIARSFFHFRKMAFDHLPLVPGQPFKVQEKAGASSGSDRHVVLPFASGSDVWSYLIIAPRKNTFNPAAAKALGVLPGPKFGLLKQGRAVASDRDPGVLVTPEQVCDTQDVGTALEAALIIDCDSAQIGIAAVTAILTASSVDVRVAVYLSRSAEDEVMPYLSTLLPATTQHVLYSAASRYFSAFPTARVHRFHLNMLAPRHFPVSLTLTHSDCLPVEHVTPSGQIIWPFSRQFRVLRGSTAPAGADDALYYPTAASAFNMLSAGFIQSTSIEVPAPASAALLSTQSGYVGFLGTGSAVPSKYRNVSGLFVCDEGGSIVVCDFGEGSIGQLALLCGPSTEELNILVRRISCVFISHMHADHNLGFFALLERWLALRHEGQKLLLVAPRVFVEFVLGMPFPSIIEAFSSGAVETVVFGESWAASRESYDAAPSTTSLNPSTNMALRDFAARSGVVLDVFPVDHPAQAHGIVAKSPTHAWMYSGDTRPTSLVVAKAKQYGPLDMLIHEATFDDSMGAEACAKKHSTLREALTTGEACGAKEILLTHFSQRYPKVPVVTDDMVHRPFCFAFDLMVVPFGSVVDLHKKMGVFQQLLQEYELWATGTGKRLREETLHPSQA